LGFTCFIIRSCSLLRYSVFFCFLFTPERLLTLAISPTKFTPAYTVVRAWQPSAFPAVPLPGTGVSLSPPPVGYQALSAQGLTVSKPPLSSASVPAQPLSPPNVLPTTEDPPSEEALLLQHSKWRYRTFAQNHPYWNRGLLAAGALALFVAIPALVQGTFSNTAHWVMRRSARYLDKTPWINGALSKAHNAFVPKTGLSLLRRMAVMAGVLWGVGALLNKDETQTTGSSPNQFWWLPPESKAGEGSTGPMSNGSTLPTGPALQPPGQDHTLASSP
jgi:hypothetical protein